MAGQTAIEGKYATITFYSAKRASYNTSEGRAQNSLRLQTDENGPS